MRVKPSLTQEALLTLFHSLILSHIRQGFPNWGSRPLAGSRNELQGSQNVYQFYKKYCINYCTLNTYKTGAIVQNIIFNLEVDST